ncbi:hypothetical protein Barb4_01088 [Bacteroidales bacterium Barb4]|nr:hypothetical protein Barb4_01088 [Bacteroidales bacterium Barb4]
MPPFRSYISCTGENEESVPHSVIRVCCPFALVVQCAEEHAGYALLPCPYRALQYLL